MSPKDAKTGTLAGHLGKLKVENVLIIAGASVDAGLARAARNIPNIDILPNAGLNVYDILRRKKLVLSKDAVDAIHARFKDCKPAKTRASGGRPRREIRCGPEEARSAEESSGQ